ncbi:unnamed protein product [Cyprideis torosa]|uniref:Glucosidase n=1 Tax=Cyprideis torosa TaxID=163714 RepID=A0A7R8WDV2_9CRUS|nr:unnamed protein product [Cyprideis torosa]CAG0895120.1 unnamed protein product [Cyprideis torosa]
MTEEEKRIKENYLDNLKWLEWGSYLSERQWGTVREDYSPDGSAWDYFSYKDALSRTYRWGEDGIAGISDRHCALCFSVALWNGKDDFIKERLFGITGNEGNHGEDCKELYYYLDNTPTHSYMKHLYKYPQKAFPYKKLLKENKKRGKKNLEYELLDTGVFKKNKYFDVFTEYAKAGPTDILIHIRIENRADEAAPLWLLPTFWMRNLWTFRQVKGVHQLQQLESSGDFGIVRATHPVLPDYHLYFEKPSKCLFTENASNGAVLFGYENTSPYVKDLINDEVVSGEFKYSDKLDRGTKFCPLYLENIEAKGSFEVKLRLSTDANIVDPLGAEFDTIFAQRIQEADEFYADFYNGNPEHNHIVRQALAGMLWSKQYYNLDMETWLRGDPGQPPPPKSRKKGRNSEWTTLNNEDIISMPDKWEYPWYASWDLAFHCIPLAMVDPEFAKSQMILMTREWYMAPNGQIPAYEWGFSDVNPPVQAWASFRIYQMEKEKTGKGDIAFLKRIINKLSLNFTWWVNRKDRHGNNVFEGGFLGLDNIGVFDRGSELPGNGYLEQADGTAWMALYSLNMLQISLEIALEDPVYEDMATKYLEHFVYIAESLNKISENWVGSWDEEEGFFYDILALPNDTYIPIKVRSLVGLMPLNATHILRKETLDRLPNFTKGMKWFRHYRRKHNKPEIIPLPNDDGDILLTLTPKERKIRLFNALFDEEEFFSDYGIRALSKIHTEPYSIVLDGQVFSVRYEPGESETDIFGGNSNWRGPIWFPINFLILEALKEYYSYYKDEIQIEWPKGSGNYHNLLEMAELLRARLIKLFEKDEHGDRPINALHQEQYRDEHFKDLILYYEYFHGDNGRGVGASHQTGWTGIVAYLLNYPYQEKHE